MQSPSISSSAQCHAADSSPEVPVGERRRGKEWHVLYQGPMQDHGAKAADESILRCTGQGSGARRMNSRFIPIAMSSCVPSTAEGRAPDRGA